MTSIHQSPMKKYFLEVARELDNSFKPKEISISELVSQAADYYERNISPELAAEFIAHKFGIERIEKVN